MVTEDYVSFEIAKLLKERGFDANLIVCYTPGGLFSRSYGIKMYTNESEDSAVECICPTLQMAMKWLREEKKLSIIIDICFDDDRDRQPGYFFDIWRLTPPYESLETPHPVFDTYEEAREEAIKYCLENLI